MAIETEGRLRVGVDLSSAVIATTGLARYSTMLWDGLVTRDDIERRALAVGRGRRIQHRELLRLPIPLRVMRTVWRTGHPRIETLLGDVDVVHCLALAPPPTRKPLVMTWHDTFHLSTPEYQAPSFADTREARLAVLPSVSVLIVQCRATLEEVVDETSFPEERIVITRPGFDIPDTPARPVPVDGPFVLAAGRITPRKGFSTLARAMALLGPDAPTLVIAGPDGYRAEAVHEDLRRALPEGKLVLLGHRTDMRSLYRRASLVCHPSLAEGFGYVCLEAMGAGAAVVAADIPAIREMGDGVVELVPPGDPEPMAEAIRALLADEHRRAELGAAAAERAATYTWDGLVDDTVAAYRHAAAG